MGVREAGSYVVDPKSGEEKLVERTVQKDGSRLAEDVAPVPEVPTMAEALPPSEAEAAEVVAEEPPKTGRRRSPETATQE
ncbi:hypothetical protein [Methylobacterium sp. Leaf85]|uniref:hypothetical protein n=1 Tax=Methylobacterium sp. Leaf85 TaxID=1736241 RepID=UPI0006FD766B|nr:hypothetical protein [Methylobacterium sp. Leaf85]KQO53071.1 hypothetical protein ASF08_19290 [Methylobacterium sp. Leaf85]